MTVARHLTIHGRVQGVFYRAWAAETARELGLTGWVRNQRDGTVEAVVQGDEAQVERFIKQARTGSPAARVERVEVSDAPTDDGLATFTQVSTV